MCFIANKLDGGSAWVKGARLSTNKQFGHVSGLTQAFRACRFSLAAEASALTRQHDELDMTLHGLELQQATTPAELR
jgi:hypothetical protein